MAIPDQGTSLMVLWLTTVFLVKPMKMPAASTYSRPTWLIPADVVAGRDPQLEKAIEIVLEELQKNPPARPQRPPYPVRVHRD